MKKKEQGWVIQENSNPISLYSRSIRLLKLVIIIGFCFSLIYFFIVPGISKLLVFLYGLPNMGLGEFTAPDGTYSRAKTLWDWLELFIIPFTLLIASLGFSILSSHKDRLLKEDDYREQALVNCFDLITDLANTNQSTNDNSLEDVVLEKNTSMMIRAHVLSTLRMLDPRRKGRLIFFLYSSHLLGYASNDHPSVTLQDADLSYIDLVGLNLSGICLESTNLYKANFRLTNLSGSHFDHARLKKANLSATVLTDSSFVGADITGCNFKDSDVNGVDFEGANDGKKTRRVFG